MLRTYRLSVIAFGLLIASGCASVGDDATYPSLERRAVEARLNPPADSPAPPPTPPSVTADLASAISALEADALRGEAAFRAELAVTQQRVAAARGAASGSAAWFAAQAAISGLDQTRAPSRLALAELDRLHLAAEMDGRGADAALLAAAAARVAAIAAGQRMAFDQLSGMLAE